MEKRKAHQESLPVEANVTREGVAAGPPSFIRRIRKKLGLTQAEAGQLFGGGASAFSEYERGKTQPHKSTVLLFKLLDKHPELLAEIR